MNLVNILIGPIVEAVRDYAKSKQEAKTRQKELDSAIQEKKLEAISKAEDHVQAIRLTMIQNAGWRPGYWTITLSIPVMMAFVPKLAPYVLEGFQVLEATPDYFQWFLKIAIGSAFGYQAIDKGYEWWRAP